MNRKRWNLSKLRSVLAQQWKPRIKRFSIWMLVGWLSIVFNIGFFPEAASANLALTTTAAAATLQTSLQGNNVTISNVTVSQGATVGQVGTFSGGLTGGAGPVLGIDDGVMMITGTATTAAGPNNKSSITTGGETGPTDTDLQTVDSGSQFDTAILSFNVVPSGNFMAMDFVFASDEYNEFVCTTFNDAMGIFVTGPDITKTNIAKLSTNSSPISINQINRGSAGAASSTTNGCTLTNSAFYVKNIADSTAESTVTANSALGTATTNAFTNLQYDGFTVPLTAQTQVTPGNTYTIKVVIADIGDSQWDSAVFIDKVRSFNIDLGDAPNSYGTQPIDKTIQIPGPAQHTTGQDIYLGAIAPDAENTVTPATSPNPANNDDITGVDDEDAFSGNLNVNSGVTTYSLSGIPLRNGIAKSAKLMGWIDFNKDGDFLDAGEKAEVLIAASAGTTTANLSWSGFPATTVGSSYARFRITTDTAITNAPSPVGLANDGEVEDYAVTIAPVITGSVFSDQNGNKLKAVSGEDYTNTDITAVLLNGTTNNVISTAVVNGTGAYTIQGVSAGSYKVKIIKTPTTALSTGVVIPVINDILPTGWVATGENNNGVIDGIVDRTQSITVAAANITSLDFGIRLPANVLVVKRITEVQGNRTINPSDGVTPLNTVVDDTTSIHATDDNNPNWKTSYLVGAIDAGKVKPGDTIEYTIYFLNAGGTNADTVRICDRISPNQTYLANSTQLQLGTSAAVTLTDAADSLDRTQLIGANLAVPINCNLKNANTNGTLVIDVTGATGTGNPTLVTLPGSTGAGAPNNSYGLIRFKTIVNP